MRDAWVFVIRRFVPWIAALNLGWEILQLPLYTIWTQASPASIAFAVIHCTLGDILIACACLFLASLLAGRGPVERWRQWRVTLVLVILGTAYTTFSEWANTSLQAWGYSEWMPTLALAGIRIGVSPLLQWLVVPPLALHLALRGSTRARRGLTPGQPERRPP